MSGYLQAEVEYLKRSIVTVNIDKFCKSDWAEDRARFEGTDEEFVIASLHKLGYQDLLDPCSEDEVGIAVEGEYDEGEIKIIGVVPA